MIQEVNILSGQTVAQTVTGTAVTGQYRDSILHEALGLGVLIVSSSSILVRYVQGAGLELRWVRNLSARPYSIDH